MRTFAFAPVNIALIKYMGKVDGKPTNSSFSLTLENLGTRTKINRTDRNHPFEIKWDPSGYVPPRVGQEKVERFLRNEAIWKEAIESSGLTLLSQDALYEIKTQNMIPAGTGIATSASGFAALTMAYARSRVREKDVFHREWNRPNSELRMKLTKIARLGSGSACRSFHGPAVQWTTQGEIKPYELAESLTDIILLIEETEKEVSSSQAHERVHTSARFEGRVERAEARLFGLKVALALHKSIFDLKSLILDEALDMHELFETSSPPFSYLKPLSKTWIERIQKNEGPTPEVLLTLDAGANVHLIVPTANEEQWVQFIERMSPGLKIAKSKIGEGASFHDDESF